MREKLKMTETTRARNSQSADELLTPRESPRYTADKKDNFIENKVTHTRDRRERPS